MVERPGPGGVDGNRVGALVQQFHAQTPAILDDSGHERGGAAQVAAVGLGSARTCPMITRRSARSARLSHGW